MDIKDIDTLDLYKELKRRGAINIVHADKNVIINDVELPLEGKNPIVIGLLVVKNIPSKLDEIEVCKKLNNVIIS